MFAEPLEQVDRTFVRHRGRKLIYFAGCDYLRLSRDPRVVRAVERTLRRAGLNVAASRKTTGNHAIYEELERATARFFGADRAVLVSNGYLSNLVAAQGLAGQIGEALLDERAHPSLKDAAKLLGCRTRFFKHRNPASLAKVMEKCRERTKVAILTDGIFAHDGSLAPLDSYRKLSGGALLWVDDSHAGGIAGEHGRGTVEHFGLSRRNLLQTVTFSKAFGVYGGAVLGSAKICDAIQERSCIAAGNTPLPLPLAGGVLEALKLLKSGRARERLRRKLDIFEQSTGKRIAPSPIVAVIPKTSFDAKHLRRRLLQAGIFPSHIFYPGAPEGGYYRFAISSEHSDGQVKTLAECIRDWV